jgi:hypothetical protein
MWWHWYYRWCGRRHACVETKDRPANFSAFRQKDDKAAVMNQAAAFLCFWMLLLLEYSLGVRLRLVIIFLRFLLFQFLVRSLPNMRPRCPACRITNNKNVRARCCWVADLCSGRSSTTGSLSCAAAAPRQQRASRRDAAGSRAAYLHTWTSCSL